MGGPGSGQALGLFVAPQIKDAKQGRSCNLVSRIEGSVVFFMKFELKGSLASKLGFGDHGM